MCIIDYFFHQFPIDEHMGYFLAFPLTRNTAVNRLMHSDSHECKYSCENNSWKWEW